MRIITINVNGLRSAASKGLFKWLAKQNADVICLQEVRAQMAQLENEAYQLPGYQSFYQLAKKNGYSGVGILCQKTPTKVVKNLGFDLADEEGRYIQVEFKDLIVASLYMPSGTSGEARQSLKYQFLDKYLILLEELLKSQRPMIICGDWNIAHKNIDLKNWKSNQKNSGFLPQERAWLDTVFDQKGFIDAFRVLNQEAEQYTWWSHRGQAYKNNVGWRIDYQVITPGLRNTIKNVEIYKGEKFSDHAPLIIDYDLKI
ncbi:MAG: exodeoxyribonuclease III [Proteobacteria bacterium]|nr:exodeoxyribonuclease III [Pseudomonadota bacterium]